MILEIHTSGPVETNAYLLGCPHTKSSVLIDAPLECSDWLFDRVAHWNLSSPTILLTHSHWDHMAEAAICKKKYGLPIWVHREDAENLQKPGADGLPLFFPVEGVKPDRLLEDGDEIQVGEILLKVLHTPGHSPGSLCFYAKEQGLLFSGDTLFQGTMGRVDFPTSSPKNMKKSLLKLSSLPADTRVYPGHGEATTIGTEKKWIDTLGELI